MRRYVFAHGEVTIEEGVYSPVVREDADKSRTTLGVLILAQGQPSLFAPEAAAGQAQESTHVHPQ